VRQQVSDTMDIEIQLEQIVLPGMSIVAKQISRSGKAGEVLTVTNRID
jgi:hypothetical protein